MGKSRFVVLVIALAFSLPFNYGGCGSDPGSSGNPLNVPSVVFRADKDTAGKIELYTNFNNESDIIKLSGAIVTGGNVIDFKISPDGTLVAYLADQIINEQFELFVVDVGGGFPVNISKLFLLSSDVYEFEWSPDSTQIAYRSNRLDEDQIELFTSFTDGSGSARISGDLPIGGNVIEFRWAFDSSLVAYIADQNVNDQFELFSTRPLRRDSFKVSAPLTFEGDVISFKWAFNSSNNCTEVVLTTSVLFHSWGLTS